MWPGTADRQSGPKLQQNAGVSVLWSQRLSSSGNKARSPSATTVRRGLGLTSSGYCPWHHHHSTAHGGQNNSQGQGATPPQRHDRSERGPHETDLPCPGCRRPSSTASGGLHRASAICCRQDSDELTVRLEPHAAYARGSGTTGLLRDVGCWFSTLIDVAIPRLVLRQLQSRGRQIHDRNLPHNRLVSVTAPRDRP